MDAATATPPTDFVPRAAVREARRLVLAEVLGAPEVRGARLQRRALREVLLVDRRPPPGQEAGSRVTRRGGEEEEEPAVTRRSRLLAAPEALREDLAGRLGCSVRLVPSLEALRSLIGARSLVAFLKVPQLFVSPA